MSDVERPELGPILLAIARDAIASRMHLAPRESGDSVRFLQAATCPELDQPAATFVTLTRNGDLRGCIGSLEAYRTLREDVAENARAAAFRDPRFAPVTAEEWPSLRVEVSLLSAPAPLVVEDEADLLRSLRPGIDGVVFSAGTRRATFLPQVWEQLPTPDAFLAQLRRKAGLAADYWSPDVRIATYQVKKWKEK